MTTLSTILLFISAFQLGGFLSWLVADHFFIRPANKIRDRALKEAKKAQELAQTVLLIHQAATAEQRKAKDNGLILSPIQVKWPGE